MNFACKFTKKTTLLLCSTVAFSSRWRHLSPGISANMVIKGSKTHGVVIKSQSILYCEWLQCRYSLCCMRKLWASNQYYTIATHCCCNGVLQLNIACMWHLRSLFCVIPPDLGYCSVHLITQSFYLSAFCQKMESLVYWTKNWRILKWTCNHDAFSTIIICLPSTINSLWF